MSDTHPDRVILIVMDSAGIGELPDAAVYGDEGSNTIGNIHRQVPLDVPTLRQLGLEQVVDIGRRAGPARGAFGRMAELSPGKDSVTGHWEIAGLILEAPFPTFPSGFPTSMIEEFERRIGRQVIGNTVASGTAIIDELGDDHVRTGRPIVYTSADSVFQIAAHEQVVPIETLYEWCEIAFEIAAKSAGVGRVIARPFIGAKGTWQRTSNRRDFALTPFAPTLLDRVSGAGQPVVAIGKVEDLFAGRGITSAVHTTNDAAGVDAIEAAMRDVPSGLIFANLVDFDTLYGHRNDVAGYAANLERFDARLAPLLSRLRSRDVLFVTADHGNDPTTPSTDHSREYVPVMIAGECVRANADIGTRASFADLGQTIADLLDVSPLENGTSFWPHIRC